MPHMKSQSFVIALLVLMIASCSAQIPPPLEFEQEYLNNQILLRAFEQVNSFSTTDILVINMTFKTDTDIVFPNNYNLRLFVREGENWKEIYEKPRERLPTGDFVFSPLKSHQMWTIFIEPDLEDVYQKYLLRVYVSGKMMDDGKQQIVASFLDIELRP